MRQICLTTSPLSAFGTSGLVMPWSARLLTSGTKYARKLERAVDSDTWIVVGDGKAEPQPMAIGCECNEPTPEALRLLVQSIQNSALGATAILVKDGDGTIMRRDVLSVLEMPTPIQRAATQCLLQVQFAPVRGWWTRQNGTGQFAF